MKSEDNVLSQRSLACFTTAKIDFVQTLVQASEPVIETSDEILANLCGGEVWRCTDVAETL